MHRPQPPREGEGLSRVPLQIPGHTCLGPGLASHRRGFPLGSASLSPKPREARSLRGRAVSALRMAGATSHEGAQPPARPLCPASGNVCELEGMLLGVTCFALHTLTLPCGRGGWWLPRTASCGCGGCAARPRPGEGAPRGSPSRASGAPAASAQEPVCAGCGRRGVLPPPGLGSEIAGCAGHRWIFQDWHGGWCAAQAPAWTQVASPGILQGWAPGLVRKVPRPAHVPLPLGGWLDGLRAAPPRQHLPGTSLLVCTSPGTTL